MKPSDIKNKDIEKLTKQALKEYSKTFKDLAEFDKAQGWERELPSWVYKLSKRRFASLGRFIQDLIDQQRQEMIKICCSDCQNKLKDHEKDRN